MLEKANVIFAASNRSSGRPLKEIRKTLVHFCKSNAQNVKCEL